VRILISQTNNIRKNKQLKTISKNSSRLKHILSILIILGLFTNCKKDYPISKNISSIKLETNYIDFHHQFHKSDLNDLKRLKKRFPYLFPSNVSDSVWLSKIKNSNEKKLYLKAVNLFGDFSKERKKLNRLFKHIKWYKPHFETPKVITLITDLDYENKIIYADSLLLISLDMYLGKETEVYQNFPTYMSKNHTREQLIVDVARKIAKKEFEYQNGRTFIESMIYEGKELHLLTSLIPNYDKNKIIGFNKKEMAWAKHNESDIWSYFIKEKLLYSTDQKLNNRFIFPAPFSKFYLESDKDSPGRIGTWIGWKIVQSYMKNNGGSILDMLALDNETIFRKSKYKPKK